MSKLFILPLAFLVIVAAACGDGDDTLTDSEAQALCSETASAICAPIYECFSADQIMAAGYPETEAACVTAQENLLDCATVTAADACEPGEEFHKDKAEQCIDELGEATCAQIMDDNFEEPASCTESCTGGA